MLSETNSRRSAAAILLAIMFLSADLLVAQSNHNFGEFDDEKTVSSAVVRPTFIGETYISNIDSNFEETYFNIGNTYLGQYDQLNNIDFLDSAFLYFKKATEINQFYVQALHNLGLCYEIKGDFSMAKSYYKKAIEIDNNYTPSLDALNSLF